jgi:hypothetical protein
MFGCPESEFVESSGSTTSAIVVFELPSAEASLSYPKLASPLQAQKFTQLAATTTHARDMNDCVSFIECNLPRDV